MLKSLTPFVLAFLMMGLIYAPSINGYTTTSNLETSTGSLMLAGHCNGDHGDGDHQRLARPEGQRVEDRRHPDVTSLPRGVADAGEGDDDDQDAIELFGEEDAALEDVAADDVGAGVGRHEKHAASEQEGFEPADQRVDDTDEAGQAGAVLAEVAPR